MVSINDLPYELLEMILELLDPELDIVFCILVSKSWLDIINASHSIVISRKVTDLKQLVANPMTKFKSITFVGVTFDHFSPTVACYLENARKVSLSNCNFVNYWHLQNLVLACGNVDEFRIHESPILSPCSSPTLSFTDPLDYGQLIREFCIHYDDFHHAKYVLKVIKEISVRIDNFELVNCEYIDPDLDDSIIGDLFDFAKELFFESKCSQLTGGVQIKHLQPANAVQLINFLKNSNNVGYRVVNDKTLCYFLPTLDIPEAHYRSMSKLLKLEVGRNKALTMRDFQSVARNMRHLSNLKCLSLTVFLEDGVKELDLSFTNELLQLQYVHFGIENDYRAGKKPVVDVIFGRNQLQIEDFVFDGEYSDGVIEEKIVERMCRLIPAVRTVNVYVDNMEASFAFSSLQKLQDLKIVANAYSNESWICGLQLPELRCLEIDFFKENNQQPSDLQAVLNDKILQRVRSNCPKLVRVKFNGVMWKLCTLGNFQMLNESTN